MSGLGVSKRVRWQHAAQGLQRLHDRVHTPGGHGLVVCWCQTRQPFRVCGDGADLCLKDHWLSRERADDFAEPAEMGRAPGGPAGSAHIVPQQKGFQTKCCGLEVTDGLCTRVERSPPMGVTWTAVAGLQVGGRRDTHRRRRWLIPRAPAERFASRHGPAVIGWPPELPEGCQGRQLPEASRDVGGLHSRQTLKAVCADLPVAHPCRGGWHRPRGDR
jgi:hypothetical protein